MDDKKYWIGFNLIKGIGAVRMQGLVSYFGELESAWGRHRLIWLGQAWG